MIPQSNPHDCTSLIVTLIIPTPACWAHSSASSLPTKPWDGILVQSTRAHYNLDIQLYFQIQMHVEYTLLKIAKVRTASYLARRTE